MLTRISNILTGRYYYWSENCNKYVAILFTRAEQFPPSISPLLKRSIVASYEIIDALVGPDHGNKRIFKIDPKKISSSQYKEMTDYGIWFFLLFLSRNIPEVSGAFIDACTDFIGEGPRDKLIANILSGQNINPEQLVSDLTTDLANIANVGGKRDLMDWVKVMVHVTYAQETAWNGYVSDIAGLRKQ